MKIQERLMKLLTQNSEGAREIAPESTLQYFDIQIILNPIIDLLISEICLGSWITAVE